MSGRYAPLALLAALVLLTGQVRTNVPAPVRLDAGPISGVSLPGDVRVFKGIPFAAPPVGRLRWRAPQPVAAWQEVRKADAFGPVCMQPKGSGRINVSVDLPGSPPASEDCLYLNVWTAAARASERRPVMVWIYGGGYTEGAGSSPHNDGEALARKGVVAITFNYRLGPFGFFSHPELSAESGRPTSGNQAMMDALAVLRWVRRNVGAFGGDPANVTIFGESAGAMLVAGLTGSPEARGLFHRAISQSGAWMGLSVSPMRTYAAAMQLAGRGGTPPASRSLADLRAMSADDVASTFRGGGMIVDGWIVPEDLSMTFAAHRQNPVDVLVGSNREEGSYAGPVTVDQWTARVRTRWGDLSDAVLRAYPAGSDAEATASSESAFSDDVAWNMRLFATEQAAAGGKAWLYYFTHEPPTDPSARKLRATHTAEIPYVFNTLKAPRTYPDTSSPELAAASPVDRAFADTVSSYWVNFAKTGNPNGVSLPAWEPFTTSRDPMILGARHPLPSAERLGLYRLLHTRIMRALAEGTNATRR